MPTGYYYIYLEFIDAMGNEMMNMFPLVSLTFDEEEYVRFNVQEEGWYFDLESVDMMLDRFDWTP